MAKDCLKRLEQIWEQASEARLTEQTPCKVQSMRFSVEGQTFLDTVQTLHESLLQGSSSSPAEEPWETLLERFTPPSDFERRVHAKYDTIPSPSFSLLMFQWEFFDTLAGACTVFAHCSSQTACDPRTALCQSTPLETLPRLPEVFATLSQKFQSVSETFRLIVNQKGEDEAFQARATFEEDCIERIMLCLRIQDGRPVALIPEEDRSRTFFIENKDKTLVCLTNEKNGIRQRWSTARREKKHLFAFAPKLGKFVRQFCFVECLFRKNSMLKRTDSSKRWICTKIRRRKLCMKLRSSSRPVMPPEDALPDGSLFL